MFSLWRLLKLRSESACLILFSALAFGQSVGDELPRWTPGTLDIHQIQTGRGNSTFLIFPDGATALLDAGAVPNRPGPQLAPARPDATRSPGAWIARYVQQFSPRSPASLDYVVLTHYHDDHIGGFADLKALVPVRKVIDRGGESPLRTPGAEALIPGRADQIVSKWPEFEVRNIAAGGVVWTGTGAEAQPVFPAGEQPSENELSIALRIRFGKFRYYTGGDLPGVVLDEMPAWHDLETPVAKVVGPVDVALLDHHGWLDTTNSFFLKTLQPRVVIVPAWHATHPDHGVVRRLISKGIPGTRDLFVTELLDAPRAILSYMPDPFKSTHGHIVVRVTEGGTAYMVYILEDADDRRRIIGIFGPYRPQ
jgi:beta-lactamase superfamily II metal-dependent hydrolase